MNAEDIYLIALGVVAVAVIGISEAKLVAEKTQKILLLAVMFSFVTESFLFQSVDKPFALAGKLFLAFIAGTIAKPLIYKKTLDQK